MTAAVPEIAIHGCVIVVRGHFNPAIFSPAWLLHAELISNQQYGDSEVSVISDEISVFRCGWANVQVGRDHLQIGTDDSEEFERLRDLIIGSLLTLRHTPIGALGINRHVHLEAPSERAWHNVGDILAPKDAWNDLLVLPGTESIVYSAVRPDSFAGRVQIQIEPSKRVAYGIYLAHNDHFGFAEVSQPESRDDFTNEPPELQVSADNIAIATQILTDGWSDAMMRAESVVVRLWQVIQEAARRETPRK